MYSSSECGKPDGPQADKGRSKGRRTRLKRALGIPYVVLLLSLGVAACGVLSLGAADTPTPQDPGTLVAQTVSAELTRLAEQATPTQTPSPTPSPVPPTPTPQPTPSLTPFPSPTPLPCNQAAFVRDLSVSDGSILPPGTAFTKMWRLRNAGTCTWTPEYDLVFIRGDRMGADVANPLPDYVLPGEMIDVSIDLQAPDQTGVFRGEWQLRDAEGVIFGLGENGQGTFWAEIQVKEPFRERIRSLAKEYCTASWRSGSANALPCPGDVRDRDGFVILLTDPALENRQENELALWTRPNRDAEGWISGTYPPIQVQAGDRFKAWVGCLEGSEGCRVEFRLDFQLDKDSPTRTLQSWREAYDEEVTIIDLDLSNLAGESVIFILYVRVLENPLEADAFWFVPAIHRIEYID